MNDKADSHHRFQTTRWSMVRGAACQSGSDQSKHALAELCELYWPPLYAYLRRCGLSPADSEDMVQGFFARLLEREDFGSLSPEKGRFRSFLLASLKHFLSNERDRARTIKRGGKARTISLECDEAERNFTLYAAQNETAEVVFERQWALTMLHTAKNRLIEEQGAQDQKLSHALIAYLTPDASLPTYADVAKEFAVSEGSVKMAISRMRKRYREILRSEIAQTVSSPQEIEEELQHLISALQS
ncbi:RNA polymerase sigma factor [Stieleria varia]|uniref:Uncharacterized protein n=1 Tax=Stieleria varia TaxID=2528005 RepID=A0A5C6ASZ4_9BACT|nr:sigma factor [Stieleria varia]TWU02531.1 hypothetical protein Pla52n_35810 [Stieleria varia]